MLYNSIRRRPIQIQLRPEVQAERIFLRYQRAACSAAKAVAKKCGRTHQEMADEAISELSEMAADWRRSYDPSRGAAPVTWIWTKIYWRLRGLCASKLRKHEHNEIPSDLPNKQSWMECFKKEVSEEAWSLLLIVLEAPGQLTREFRKGTTPARLALIEHLQSHGWSDKQIDAAWTEVQECL